ncbi:MAG: hypothetical protein ACI8TQ_001428 [Planctomycetota bacterium]|jgi:hypothetical protein
MQQGSPDPAEVERALARVFSRPEFEKDERTLLDDFFEWISDTFDFEGSTEGMEGIVNVLMNVLLVLLAAALIWLVMRFALEYARNRASTRRTAALPGNLIQERVRELHAAARAARADGNAKLAIQLGLFALVTGLGARGAFEYRDVWTYREILSNGNPKESAFILLNELVNELEAKEFGEEPISEHDLDQLDSLCVEHLSGFLEVAA